MNAIPSLQNVDFAALSPLLILLVGALSLLLCESFFQRTAKKHSFTIALATLVIALYAAWIAPVSEHPLLTNWLKFDSLARFFTLFFLWIGLAATLLSHSFFQRFALPSRGEYFFLLLSALFGLILIGSSADFLTLFLGIETLSISLYVLCNYVKGWTIAQESSIKYFFMGAIAAGFLLYGVALIYGAIGTTHFDSLFTSYNSLATLSGKTLFLSGIALVTIALAFEAAVVPFHAWAPDVYCGATTSVTAFMAVGTKVGAFVAFIRLFLEALPHFNPLWNQGIALLAYPTLLYANIVAIRQSQLRRFFAYSGISHAGFLLLPLAASASNEALSAINFYLVIYALATFVSFAVLAFLDREEEGVLLRNLEGLFYRSPLLALFLTIGLLTLAGIPPTAGFLAKFYLLKIAFDGGYYALVIVALLTTILSAFYYLRIISLLFSKEAPTETPPLLSTGSWPAYAVGIICSAALFLFSWAPSLLLQLLLNK